MCVTRPQCVKIMTVAVELNSYSNIKGVNSIKNLKKVGCCDIGRGGGDMVSNWGYSCLAMLVSLFSFPWWHIHSTWEANSFAS